MLSMLFYGIGVLAFYNSIIFFLAAAITGNYSRDKTKTSSYGTAFLAVYIVLYGTALLCKRIGQAIDMGLLMANAMMQKRTVLPPAPPNHQPANPATVPQQTVEDVLAGVPRRRRAFPKPDEGIKMTLPVLVAASPPKETTSLITEDAPPPTTEA